MSVFFFVFYKALKPSAPDKGANNNKNPMTNSNKYTCQNNVWIWRICDFKEWEEGNTTYRILISIFFKPIHDVIIYK